MKKWILIFGILIGILGGALFLGMIHQPYGKAGQVTVLKINQGEGLNQIATKLESKGLIRSRQFFKWYSVALGKSKSFKRGYYQIKSQKSVGQLIDILNKGSEQMVKVTIPEGWRMTEIFQLLQKLGLGKVENFLALSDDQSFIQSLGLTKNILILEGYLFPDTYFFSQVVSEKIVLAAMVRNFLQRIPQDYAQLASNVNLSYYEAVILAAIIEKETGQAWERKIISSVFHNRLQKKMKLQTDPTVIYGIDKFDGNLTRKQLRTRTPYNTYKIKGLPPTPIANPGIAALIAAVQPAKTNYLYFVAMGDGRHKFSSNYKEHNRAVTQFQRKRRKNYRSY